MTAEYFVRIREMLDRRNGAGIHFIKYVGNSVYHAKRVDFEWEEKPEVFTFPDPTLIVDTGLLSALAKEMQTCKELPKDLIDNDAELAAVRRHLEDLKKIAFHKLGIK